MEDGMGPHTDFLLPNSPRYPRAKSAPDAGYPLDEVDQLLLVGRVAIARRLELEEKNRADD